MTAESKSEFLCLGAIRKAHQILLLLLFVLPVAVPWIWPSSSLQSATKSTTAASSNAPAALELKISGPGLIRVGQEVSFKVVVINHSAHPILIADRSTGKMWSNFLWNVVDAKGQGVPTAPVDLQKVLIDDMSGPLSDPDVHILEPGKTFVYKLASDPTASSCSPSNEKVECMQKRIFPGKGMYRVWLHYRFAPAREADYLNKATGTLTLSERNIEVLRMTPPVDIFSNEWIVNLQ